MGHSISEIVEIFNIPRALKYAPGIPDRSYYRPPWTVFNGHKPRHMARIVCGNREGILAQITCTLNSEVTRRISSRLLWDIGAENL